MKDNKMEDSQLQNSANEVEVPKNFTYAEQKMINAYKASTGNITKACELACYSRAWFYIKYNGNQDFKDEIDAITEQSIDFAEDQLNFLMKGQYVYRKKKNKKGEDIEGQFEVDAEGNPIRDYITPIDGSSVRYMLSTKGKKRGYTFRQEITGADGNAIGGMEITITNRKKRSDNS